MTKCRDLPGYFLARERRRYADVPILRQEPSALCATVTRPCSPHHLIYTYLLHRHRKAANLLCSNASAHLGLSSWNNTSCGFLTRNEQPNALHKFARRCGHPLCRESYPENSRTECLR